MRVIPYIALALLSLTLLAGCEEDPAENAGEELDEAIENGQESLEEMGEETEEAMEETEEELEE